MFLNNPGRRNWNHWAVLTEFVCHHVEAVLTRWVYLNLPRLKRQTWTCPETRAAPPFKLEFSWFYTSLKKDNSLYLYLTFNLTLWHTCSPVCREFWDLDLLWRCRSSTDRNISRRDAIQQLDLSRWASVWHTCPVTDWTHAGDGWCCDCSSLPVCPTLKHRDGTRGRIRHGHFQTNWLL